MDITLRDETILNKEVPSNLYDNDIPVNDDNLAINRDPPSPEEMRKAVTSMKSRKTPGIDSLNADLLKAGGYIIVRI